MNGVDKVPHAPEQKAETAMELILNRQHVMNGELVVIRANLMSLYQRLTGEPIDQNDEPVTDSNAIIGQFQNAQDGTSVLIEDIKYQLNELDKWI